MKVWLVNPFDPLPGEQEQLGRYGHLALALRDAGHEVVWWSSTFSHRFKRPVDAARVALAASKQGIRIELVPTPPYARNVSLRRIRNHRVFGRRLRERAAGMAKPDVILASSPPLESAYESARLGREWDCPTVIDIQDQWPDNFLRVVPGPIRPVGRLALKPFYALERDAYTLADAIVGVAQGYVDRGLAVGGDKVRHAVFPLGVSLDDLRAAIDAGRDRYADRWKKPEGEVRLLYSGSLSHNYDFLTIIRAAIATQQRYGSRVRFVLTGTGELADRATAIIREHALENVTMTGFLDFPEWAYVLSQTDVGFNASFPEALIYLPNKIFAYLAVGAAVLNTIPGECAELLARSGCGLTYTAGDVDGCFEAVGKLVESPDRLARMHAASIRLAEERFDRPIICAEFTRFLEAVATDRLT